MLALSLAAHFLRVGWGDFYRLGLFQVMEDDHLSSYTLYWSDPGLFKNDVIRERALTMTAGSIQRWLPVLTGGFLPPGVWSQFWALFQEVGVSAGVFWLAWLGTRNLSVSVFSSVLATAANPSAWNWAIFSGGFTCDYPASAALVVALWILGLVLRERWNWIPFLSLLCALLHPSIGLWSSLLLAVWLIAQEGRARLLLSLAVLAGACFVALGQILVGSFSPVVERIGGREFQDLCRLNWHLQPWWEPASGAWLARLMNAFLPCSFLIFAAREDRGFCGLLSPVYLRLVGFLTVGAWAGFFLGVIFFYTGVPALILSSPVRVGAIWAYASVPLLAAYLHYLLGRTKVLDAGLAFLALAGLFVWDGNLFLRYPTLGCAFFLWVRQLRLPDSGSRFLSVASALVCVSWVLVLLLESMWVAWPQAGSQAFSALQSLRPGWTEQSWQGALAPLQTPGMAFFYGVLLLALAAFCSPLTRRAGFQWGCLCAGVTVLLCSGAWEDRQARARAVSEALEIKNVMQAVDASRTPLLSPENRSLRFLLERPVVLLGFYNNNIYTRSQESQRLQNQLLQILGVPIPKTNREVNGIQAKIRDALEKLSTSQGAALAKISGAGLLLRATDRTLPKNPADPASSPGRLVVLPLDR